MDMGDLTTGEAEAWRAGWRAMSEPYQREPGLGVLHGSHYTPEQAIQAMIMHVETLALAALNSVPTIGSGRQPGAWRFAPEQARRATALVTLLMTLDGIRRQVRP